MRNSIHVYTKRRLLSPWSLVDQFDETIVRALQNLGP